MPSLIEYRALSHATLVDRWLSDHECLLEMYHATVDMPEYKHALAVAVVLHDEVKPRPMTHNEILTLTVALKRLEGREDGERS